MQKSILLPVMFFLILHIAYAGTDDCPSFGSSRPAKTVKTYQFHVEKRTEIRGMGYTLQKHKTKKKRHRAGRGCCCGSF